MRIYYDITSALTANDGQPKWGLMARYLGNDCSPLYPMRPLYVPQVQQGVLSFPADSHFPPDDGLPVMLDDEGAFSFASAGGDLTRLQAICRGYLEAFKIVRNRAPSCPLGCYGFLPDAPDQLKTYGQALKDARTPLAMLADWACIDTGETADGKQFDAQLAWTDQVIAEFPHLQAVALVRPKFCDDTEFTRRMEAAANKPGVSAILVWVSSTEVPVSPAYVPADLAPSFPQIARAIALKYPGGVGLRSKASGGISLPALSDQQLSDHLIVTVSEVNARQSALGLRAKVLSAAETSAKNMIPK